MEIFCGTCLPGEKSLVKGRGCEKSIWWAVVWVLILTMTALSTRASANSTSLKQYGWVNIFYLNNSVFAVPIMICYLESCILLFRYSQYICIDRYWWFECAERYIEIIRIIVVECDIGQRNTICKRSVADNRRCIWYFSISQRCTSIKPICKVWYWQHTHIRKPYFGDLFSQMRPWLIGCWCECIAVTVSRNGEFAR